MKIFVEICKAVIPPIMTGVISFFIATYKQRKNIPLDKMEIAYNRVYYPLFKMLRNKQYDNINHIELQNTMELLLKKYDKYISQSTRYTYSVYLENYCPQAKKNKYYENFENNILSYNCRIRSILGYPQAGLLEIYFYLDKNMKRLVNVCICMIILYICALIYQFIPNKYLLFLFSVALIYIIYAVVRYCTSGIMSVTKRVKK